MAMSSSTASVMSASLPTKPSSCPRASLSSSNSVFFSNVGRVRLAARSSRRRDLRCRCLFGLGVPEVAVIAGVAALVFGPSQIPVVGQSFGKTIKSFQQAAKEFEAELKKETEDVRESPAIEAQKVINSNDDKMELKPSATKESA
ncbi:sec-independent protein translocase protein TATA, chloroplastic-like [Phoenix dactylifera]|uniref:Sec-independent protein translocase protein TATA, chloroplastic-like n=1 Tax=Phoenix dactylifera TaxID=42345 RepID=A0A8B7CRG2_PHODC|nr:sec-independent protein translocase protein TATA, chloroplastic-like [Phoenix dactylifera]